jgi:hypothetical protein
MCENYSLCGYKIAVDIAILLFFSGIPIFLNSFFNHWIITCTPVFMSLSLLFLPLLHSILQCVVHAVMSSKSFLQRTNQMMIIIIKSEVRGDSNMTGTDLCVNKPQSVPVIFEPPCIWSPCTLLWDTSLAMSWSSSNTANISLVGQSHWLQFLGFCSWNLIISLAFKNKVCKTVHVFQCIHIIHSSLFMTI